MGINVTEFAQNFVGRRETTESVLSHQNILTRTIYEKMRRDHGSDVHGASRDVINKQEIANRLNKCIQPVERGEPMIDRSLVDDRILEGFIPELLPAVQRGEIHPTVPFVIIEHYLRNGWRGLSKEQAIMIARNFDAQQTGENFYTYRQRVEQGKANVVVQGRSLQESKDIRREVLDTMEIMELLKDKYLIHSHKKTIYLSDLVKVSVDAWRMLYEASTSLGVKRIMLRDKRLCTESSSRTTAFRSFPKELRSIISRHPLVFLGMTLSPERRIFTEDMEKLFQRPSIVVEGVEHIPVDGPLIIAFSHNDRWYDRNISPGWEKIKMIEVLQGRRIQKNVALVAYINYFKEIIPKKIRGIGARVVDNIVHQLHKMYSINILDIDASPQRIKYFYEQARELLNRNGTILISPEGLPAPEILKPRKGVGVLARISGAPVVGVAFREDERENGTFQHKVIFTPPQRYDASQLIGRSGKEKDQAFADKIMRSIALCLPEEQRGIFL